MLDTHTTMSVDQWREQRFRLLDQLQKMQDTKCFHHARKTDQVGEHHRPFPPEAGKDCCVDSRAVVARLAALG